MLWLIVIGLFLANGYAIVLLGGMSLRNLVADISLAWFCGTTWYMLAHCVLVYCFGVEPTLGTSLTAIVLPLGLAWIKRSSLRAVIDAGVQSLRTTVWWPRRFTLLWCLPAAISVTLLTAAMLHGVSTPTNADDAVWLRAYTPILVYQGDAQTAPNCPVMRNGGFVSFGPQLIWQLRGKLDHFDINYFLQTTFFFFFFLLIYAVCAARGQPEQGIGTLFLFASLPLFLYHLSATQSDALASIAFAAALFFFALEVVEQGEDWRPAFFLFVTLTASIKDDGEIMALTILAVYFGWLAVRSWKRSFPSGRWLACGLGPLIVYLSIKALQAPNATVAAAFGILPTSHIPLELPDETAGTMNLSHAHTIFWGSLFASGNFGIVFYVFSFSLVYFGRVLWRRQLFWPGGALALVFLEVYLNAVVVNPQWTLNQTVVHRSVILVASGAAILTGFLWSCAAAETTTPELPDTNNGLL